VPEPTQAPGGVTTSACAADAGTNTSTATAATVAQNATTTRLTRAATILTP
jgi:hypothetical protein